MEEGRRKLTIVELGLLSKPGVYVLYRDEHPDYIGNSTRPLVYQLHDHANQSTSKYFNLWNYFSAFAVDKKYSDDVEEILIAAMPTANSAAPKIKLTAIPRENQETAGLGTVMILLAYYRNTGDAVMHEDPEVDW